MQPGRERLNARSRIHSFLRFIWHVLPAPPSYPPTSGRSTRDTVRVVAPSSRHASGPTAEPDAGPRFGLQLHPACGWAWCVAATNDHQPATPSASCRAIHVPPTSRCPWQRRYEPSAKPSANRNDQLAAAKSVAPRRRCRTPCRRHRRATASPQIGDMPSRFARRVVFDEPPTHSVIWARGHGLEDLDHSVDPAMRAAVRRGQEALDTSADWYLQ